MSFKIDILPKTIEFKVPVGTSRGWYATRKVWYLYLSLSQKENPNICGIGECAPLPNLSCDDLPNYEDILRQMCDEFLQNDCMLNIESLRKYPSILFGLETALLHYKNQSLAFWKNDFSQGKRGININGLIWMGDYANMKQQIAKKISAGFKCIKLKIGAINFEEELDLISRIRKDYSPSDIEIRVDANGAFSPKDVEEKLCRLAKFHLHSIEQPIRAGQWQEMKDLAKKEILPIALDEELIGISRIEHKREMLTFVKPQYIIIKPSLHGGMLGGDEWIEIAEHKNIGWWITSAMETNVGLNSIAQWCATKDTTMPQGLGTGSLFKENFETPLQVINDKLWFKE